MPTPQQAVIAVLPAPPRPPAEYTYEFGMEMNRWLCHVAAMLTGTNYLRGGGLSLAPESFPTSGAGLKPGEVFSNDGVLTWVQVGDIWIGGLAIEAELGTLTVTV